MTRKPPEGTPESLLWEVLEHITDKPWDDPSLLHARISERLGLPVQYPEHVARRRLEEGEGDA